MDIPEACLLSAASSPLCLMQCGSQWRRSTCASAVLAHRITLHLTAITLRLTAITLHPHPSLKVIYFAPHHLAPTPTPTRPSAAPLLQCSAGKPCEWPWCARAVGALCWVRCCTSGGYLLLRLPPSATTPAWLQPGARPELQGRSVCGTSARISPQAVRSCTHPCKRSKRQPSHVHTVHLSA